MDNKKKYAFYISGKSGRLSKFLTQADEDIIKQIKLVISDYIVEAHLDELLKEKSIPVVVVDYLKLKGDTNKKKNKQLSDIMMENLDNSNIDYCFSFGSHLLSGKLLDKYKNKLINFHPAILPMFPGNKAIDQAVEGGNVFLVGNTAHFIDEGMDTGKIIMQSVIPLQAFLTDRNYDVVLNIQINMLNKLISVLNDDRIVFNNGEPIIEGADYTFWEVFPQL